MALEGEMEERNQNRNRQAQVREAVEDLQRDGKR